MIRFVTKRIGQAALTILGVMIVTFFLFRVMAGDIAATYVGAKGTEQSKAAWRHRYGYDRPLLLNVHNRLMVEDKTTGKNVLSITDIGKSRFVDQLSFVSPEGEDNAKKVLLGKYIFSLPSSQLF